LRREEGLSDLLGTILVTLCVWGLVSALLLQLIDIRSVFIEGGATRLRVGMISFALGVILIEYMTRVLGKAPALNYKLALGAVMLLFSAYHAYGWRLPTHPIIVFLVEIILVVILWIVIWNISRSCSLGTRKLVEAAGDSGMLGSGLIENGGRSRPLDRMTTGRKAILWVAVILPGACISMFLMGVRLPVDIPAWITGVLSLLYLGVFVIIVLFLLARKSGQRKERLTSASGIVNDEDQLLQLMMGVPGREKEPESSAPEKNWMERSSPRHPGIVILYFSLFALPLFGLGVHLFDMDQSAARLRVGAYLFIYLWCALALLCLATLNQLRSYFSSRRVTLPDSVGIVWLALGLGIVSIVMFAAFLLPQPPSAPGMFVRDRVIAMYQGWEADFGTSQDGPGPGKSVGEDSQDGTPVESDSKNTDSAGGGQHEGDNAAAQEARSNDTTRPPEDDLMKSQAERAYKNLQEMSDGFSQSMRRIFDGFIRVVGYLMGLCGIILVIFLVYLFWAQFRGRMLRLRALREMKSPGWHRKSMTSGVRHKFPDFKDPFSPGGSLDMEQVVHYLWDAMSAWCEDNGDKITTDQTPHEFVTANREVLSGFYGKALFLADLLDRSRYSGRPLGREWLPNLKDFWISLQKHARRGS
jgi:hypothetical protein